MGHRLARLSSVGALLCCAVGGSVTGCIRADTVDVRMRDPAAVGVVGDAKNEWLLPPSTPPKTVEIYRNPVLTATLTREPSGAIAYTSESWALGTRRDTTELTTGDGRASWVGTPSSSERLEKAMEHGGPVRLYPVTYVKATGPVGLCNGTLFNECVTNPAVRISVATLGSNIEEVHIVRKPLRVLGVGEVILGTALLGVAGTGAGLAWDQPAGTKNVVLGVGVGVAVLGGLILGNGLWNLLTPKREIVFREGAR